MKIHYEDLVEYDCFFLKFLYNQTHAMPLLERTKFIIIGPLV